MLLLSDKYKYNKVFIDNQANNFMSIQSNKFKVIVKPNSKENRIIDFNKENNIYRINIKAKAEDNKANFELIKFLSKSLKKKVRIVSGFKSREKVVEITDKQ